MLSKCICKDCGTEFEAKRSDARYCLSCRKERTRVVDLKSKEKNKEKFLLSQREYNKTRIKKTRKKIVHEPRKCIYCDVVFVPKRKDQVSCRLRDKQHRPNEKPNKTNVVCEFCGKKFETDTSYYNRSMRTRGYITCSESCSYLIKGQSKEFTCDHCGKPSKMPMSQYSKCKHHFCDEKCKKADLKHVLRGEESYLYKDGNTCLKRGTGWTIIRRQIRERDNYTCQHCGKTEEELGKRLDVHHIKPYKEFKTSQEANVEENLVALCSSCHHKFEVRTHLKKIKGTNA